VCARGSNRAPVPGPSTSPLEVSLYLRLPTPMDAKRKYIVGATVAFSLAMTILFTSMIWPDGMHSGRDFGGFALLLLLDLAGGLVFSLLTWNALKGWFR